MPHVNIETMQNHRVTIVQVEFVDPDNPELHLTTTTGEAMRHPADKNHPEVGYELALGRALTRLGRKLTRRGNGMVRMHEHNDNASRRARRLRELEEITKDTDAALEMQRAAMENEGAPAQ